MTRAQIAAAVHRKLGQLATDAGLSTAESGDQTEGSYTDAIDAALRQLGAYDPDTEALDAALVGISSINALLRIVEGEMLERLQRHYALLTDIKVGQRDEKLSQIGAALRALAAAGATNRAGAPVIARPLRREAYDFELFTADEDDE